MWRLIVVTFGFLGWAFYQLSGGADYVPAQGSRQHVAALKAAEPTVQPRKSSFATLPGSAANGGDTRVVLASATTPLRPANVPLSDAEKRLRLTLNQDRQVPGSDRGPRDSMAGVATVAADPDKIARLVAAAGAVRPATAARPAAATATPASAADDRDLRQVSASRVNMRQGPGTDFSVVDRLTQGTAVEVLRDEGTGWVELRVLDTGRVGWMADYLLAAAN